MTRIGFQSARISACGYLLLTMAVTNFTEISATSAAVLTKLAEFNIVNGANPESGLLADAAGNLYGTTHGGLNNEGTIFRLDGGTNVLTTLAEFNGANGAFPVSGLIADAAGNLYGTTYKGGESNLGVVYRLEAGTNTLTTLAEFDGTNGARPFAGLIADAAGNLYGTTYMGGASNLGVIYRLEAGTNTLTTLVEFNGANGAYPYAGLITDTAGNLYGTTVSGMNNQGTIFRLASGSNTLATLAEFNGANGAFPESGLIADAAGNLYGTTTFGGVNRRGTIFRLEAGTSSLTSFAEFNDSNFTVHVSGLIADADGNLYGTRSAAPHRRGEIFRLAAGTNILTTLAMFDVNGPYGANPRAALIADAAGNLYGTTLSGGVSGYGTIIKLSDAGFVVVPEPASLALSAAAACLLIGQLNGTGLNGINLARNSGDLRELTTLASVLDRRLGKSRVCR